MEDLFGEEHVPKVKLLPSEKAHTLLLEIYGKAEGKRCGNCTYFFFRVMAKKYPKCQKANLKGHSPNHDWRVKWQACGLFKEEKK